MHNEIRRFSLTGTVTPDGFISAREALIKEVEDGMRDEGFIPVLDLLPQFTRSYDPDDETFTFELSIYGVHIGEEESWSTAGMMNGTLIKKSTHPQK